MQPLRRGDAGAVVAEVRATLAQLGLLGAVEPPLFDAACELAVRAFQQPGRKVPGGRPQLLREDAHLPPRGPSLLGKKIVIDPGHGGSDPGATAAGERESVLVWDLASRLEGRLEACGVTAYLTRG